MSLVFGAGGVARELAWILDEAIAEGAALSRPEAFVVPDAQWQAGRMLGDLPVIAESLALQRTPGPPREAYLAVGLPVVRRKIHAAIGDPESFRFPNVVSSRASMDRRPGRIRLGKGIIVYPQASLTTDITLGDFVQVNPGATIAHGCTIDAFSTVCPGAHLSGDVHVGANCFIGAGAVIREGLEIAPDCIIGAGCVVVSSIRDSGTWVGVPARKLDP